MSFKDLLVPLTSFPNPTSVEAIDQAIGFAEIFGAHIAGITFEVEIPRPISFYTDAVVDISGMIAQARATSAANARELMSVFEAAAARLGVAHEQIVKRCIGVEIAELLIEHARLRDLTLIPVRDNDSVNERYAEAVIFGSGRPTLVLPENSRRGRTPSLDTVAVAWDFSRPAARAISDALPLLQRAKLVRVFTVINEKDIVTGRSRGELAQHLARHGVEILLEDVDAERRTIGEALETYVTSRNADLLVMGAYGHSHLREFILGGATRSMLARPPSLPVLLSH